MWGLEHTVLILTLCCFKLCLLTNESMRACFSMSSVEAGGYFGSGGGGEVCAQLLVLKLFSPIFESLCWMTTESHFGKQMQVLVCRKGSKLNFLLLLIPANQRSPGITLGCFLADLWKSFLCVESNIFITEILKSPLDYYDFLKCQAKGLALPFRNSS